MNGLKVRKVLKVYKVFLSGVSNPMELIKFIEPG